MKFQNFNLSFVIFEEKSEKLYGLKMNDLKILGILPIYILFIFLI